MPKRTSINQIDKIESANDIEDMVFDKRAGWRANQAKARRRQRRYKRKMTKAIFLDALNQDDTKDDTM